MRKIQLSILSCFIYFYSLSQPIIGKDSVETNTPPPAQVEHKAKPSVSIYPNPAKNKITLQVKGFEPGMVKVKVMDMKGKLMREDTRLLTNGNEDVIMFLMLPQGIYFILFYEKDKVVKKKLVIQ